MSGFNNTTLVLIPQVQDPNNIRQSRPVSLCNVLFQIISKTIARRFRKALHYCIDETQRTFLPGQQITDNILVAYELLHSFKQKRKGI